MADRVEKVTQVVNDDQTSGNSEVRQVSETRPANTTLASRVIWYIAGVILVLLAFRFVFALLGANTSNGFANFIYSTSHPLVAPFFGIFGYNLRYGVSRFETYTLVAMVVYAVIAWGLARLVRINQAPRNA